MWRCIQSPMDFLVMMQVSFLKRYFVKTLSFLVKILEDTPEKQFFLNKKKRRSIFFFKKLNLIHGMMQASDQRQRVESKTEALAKLVKLRLKCLFLFETR